jgi:hypothetical protein
VGPEISAQGQIRDPPGMTRGLARECRGGAGGTEGQAPGPGLRPRGLRLRTSLENAGRIIAVPDSEQSGVVPGESPAGGRRGMGPAGRRY